MTIMTIRIPDDVKEASDKAFEGQDMDAIIAQLIRDGLAARAAKTGHEHPIGPVPDLVQRFRDLRKEMPWISQHELLALAGRRPSLKIVIDASVAAKWFYRNKPGEQDVNPGAF